MTPKPLLPTEDFVTPQGVRSKTFVPPPLDGSLCLAQMVDWHGQHSPRHTWAVFLQNSESKIIKSVKWKMLQAAMHRVAQTIMKSLNQQNKPQTIAVLANRDQLTYIAILAGILRTGNSAFLISPRNSSPGVNHLLKASNAVAVIGSSDFNERKLIQSAVEEVPNLKVINAPVYEEVFDKTIDEAQKCPLLPEMEGPSDNSAVSIIIHSSGSTAFPKPIPLSHIGVLQWVRIPMYGHTDMHGERVGIQSAPPFHGMGFYHALSVPCSSGCEIAVFTPQDPPMMPNPDRVLRSFIDTKITISTGPPTNLVQWVKDDDAVKFLASLKYVRVGSGPVPTEVGNTLVEKGVKLLNGWGTTEVGVLSNPSPKETYGKDWEYIQCTQNCKPFFKPLDDDGKFYEICFPCTPTHIPSVFTNNEEKIYETNDMVTLHPTKPGFFKIAGRVDDQIMLSTGEKTNPGPMENIIRSSPLLKQCIYFGRARFQNGILVQPDDSAAIDTTNTASVASFRNRIWPLVQKANEIAPTHSRVFKEMILVASKDKPFLLTPKGTVSRPRTLDLYKDEIDAIYDLVEQTGYVEGSIGFPDKADLTKDSCKEFVAKVLQGVMRPSGGSIDWTVDLFEQGCDSLQASVIRNRISTELRQREVPTKDIPQNWLYTNPTLEELSNSVFTVAQGGQTLSNKSSKNIEETLRAAVMEYSSNIKQNNGILSVPKQRCVMITGTTGTLGSYLLYEFYTDATVDQVYAVNRSSKGQSLMARQQEAWKDRGIDTKPLHNSKIKLVEADLSRADFGISPDLYNELHANVTIIIHNAWRLDFNLGLQSFMPNIKGVRNLVDFALTSPFKSPPMLINTSSVGVVSSDPRGWVTESSPNVQNVAPTGYGRSKYVSEKILETAREASGMVTVNVRIGQLCGSKVNGAWNPTDWFPMIVKSSEETRCLPDGGAPIAWIPVDDAARIINEFTKAPEIAGTVHLVHPNVSSWNTVISIIAQLLCVDLTDVKSWIEKVESSESAETNPAVKLLPFYKGKAETMYRKEAAETHEAFGLPRLRTEDATSVSSTLKNLPPLTADDVRTWVGYWTKIGFLHPKAN